MQKKLLLVTEWCPRVLDLARLLQILMEVNGDESKLFNFCTFSLAPSLFVLEMANLAYLKIR